MIKKGLKVRVLTGKDKKKEGEVIEIDRANNRVKVKEINMVKKHVKTTKEKIRLTRWFISKWYLIGKLCKNKYFNE